MSKSNLKIFELWLCAFNERYSANNPKKKRKKTYWGKIFFLSFSNLMSRVLAYTSKRCNLTFISGKWFIREILWVIWMHFIFEKLVFFENLLRDEAVVVKCICFVSFCSVNLQSCFIINIHNPPFLRQMTNFSLLQANFFITSYSKI